jgi:transcriptional regulator GlxA family with amidase domain
LLRLLASRCQLVAGAIADSSSRTLSEDLASLQAAIPAIARLPERLMIRSLIAAVIARVLSDKDLAVRVNIMDAFLAWTARDASAPNWHSDTCSLIERCVQALNRVSAPRQERLVTDSRVRQAMVLLDTGFHRPTMSLRMCATEMHLSVWHASRLLKEHTGIGFVDHLHKRRIQAAQALLRDVRLSVKQVAAAVGYGSVTQLGRHFRVHTKMTPIQFRRSAARQKAAA